jgi:TolA-binding protein
MKESTLIDMQKKIEALTNVVQFLLQENQNIKTLASGTFETLRLMPGYETAVNKLAEQVKADAEAKKEKVVEEPKLEVE